MVAWGSILPWNPQDGGIKPPPAPIVAPYLQPAPPPPPVSIIKAVPAPPPGVVSIIPPVTIPAKGVVSIIPPVTIPGSGVVTQPIVGQPQPFVVPVNGGNGPLLFKPSLPSVVVNPPAYQPPSSITPAVPGGVGSGGTLDPMANLAAAYAGMFSGMGDGSGGGVSGALPQSIVPAPATDSSASGPNWAMVGVLLAVATLVYLWWQHRKKGKQVAP